MKTEKKSILKLVLILAGVGLAAFIVWEIARTVKAGIAAGKNVEDALKSALNAPLTAARTIWSSVTGFISGGGSNAPEVAPVVAPDSPLYGLTVPGTDVPINSLGTSLLVPPAPPQFDWLNYNPQ